MRRLPTLASLLGVAGVLAVLPFLLSAYHVSLVAKVGIFFIGVLGLNILTGYTGQISIGHGAFMAIGGYTTAVLSRDHDMNLVLTMLAAFALCFVFGVLVGLPALRFSGVYLALVTFALAVSVPQLPLKWSKFLGGRDGVQTSRTVSHPWLYGAAWTASAILFVLAWLILRGRIGRAFRAVRDSEIAAVSAGVNLAATKTLAFALSGVYAGVAGSLLAIQKELVRLRRRRGLAVRPCDERLRGARRVRRRPLPRAPDRSGRRGARVALGDPRRRRVRRAPARRLDERAGDRLRTWARRRLRCGGDHCHASAA